MNLFFVNGSDKQGNLFGCNKDSRNTPNRKSATDLKPFAKLRGGRLWVVLGISMFLVYRSADPHYILPFLAQQRLARTLNPLTRDYNITGLHGLAAAAPNNLVCIVAVGRNESLRAVSHNVYRHFSGWDCIVFVWASEEDLSSSNSAEFKKIASMCTIKRHVGMAWGDFLFEISPAMLKRKMYSHVAILLDDVWLPSEGEQVVSVPRLLASMKRNKLDLASPAVFGAHHDTTTPKKWPTNKCIVSVHFVEIFLTVYTTDMWQCLYTSLLDKSNTGGWCYDKCLKKVCGGTHGVDYTMVAHHLEEETPLSLAKMAPQHVPRVPKHRGTYGNIALCKRYGCTYTPFLQGHGLPLECYP